MVSVDSDRAFLSGSRWAGNETQCRKSDQRETRALDEAAHRFSFPGWWPGYDGYAVFSLRG